MILTCPECATSYFVDDSRIPPEGRKVKCANCGARWAVARDPEPAPDPEPEIGEPEVAAVAGPTEPEPAAEAEANESLAMGDLEIGPLPTEPKPKAKARSAPKAVVNQAGRGRALLWAGVAGGLALLAILAVVLREQVVRLAPATSGVYAGLGLPTGDLGLVIEDVRTQPGFDAGTPILTVTGAIRNLRDQAAEAPPMTIHLLDSHGREVASRIARAPDGQIPPGAKRYFAVALTDPPANASDIKVAFDAHAESAAASAHGEPAQGEADHAAPAHDSPAAAHGPEPVDAKPLPADHEEALPHHE